MKVNIKKLRDEAIIPTYGSPYSAGMDLYACIPDGELTIDVAANRNEKIGTGIAMEIPEGYFGAIFARSGLATKRGLRPANCVGVVDSDYRGEIVVALYNDKDSQLGMETIKHGDRIAQMVLIPYRTAELVEVDDLSNTARGTGGFGSTGVSYERTLDNTINAILSDTITFPMNETCMSGVEVNI